MIEFIQTMFIAVALVIFFLAFTWAFAQVCMEIDKLVALISGKRRDRKLFKTVERCRRDFA